MRLLTIFSLAICLLAIWMGFPSVIGRNFHNDKQGPKKPGECPIHHLFCIRHERNNCARDDDCKGMQKCCLYACALRCVDPWIF